MLLTVHQCFLMMLSRKIIVRKATLQTTNNFFRDYVMMILGSGAFGILFPHGCQSSLFFQYRRDILCVSKHVPRFYRMFCERRLPFIPESNKNERDSEKNR